LHGYHKETLAEVIATCKWRIKIISNNYNLKKLPSGIKIAPENKAIFRADKMHYKNNMKFMVQKAMEIQNTTTQPAECTSAEHSTKTNSEPS
jgi:hypothetical protein